ncbi:unnamed protein product, partial [marine sediment metagenome]
VVSILVSDVAEILQAIEDKWVEYGMRHYFQSRAFPESYRGPEIPDLASYRFAPKAVRRIAQETNT